MLHICPHGEIQSRLILQSPRDVNWMSGRLKSPTNLLFIKEFAINIEA